MATATPAADTKRPIYIKRVKKVVGAHHGGAWKVAYADFVTAMMAFFMVMWLVAAVSKDQRAAIFDYFKNPSMEPGKSAKPAPGQMGPGGASTSPIDLGGGLDSPKTQIKKANELGANAPAIQEKPEELAAREADEMRKALEKQQLDALMQDLKEAIGKSQALQPFKDQLLLDITPEGLRIQILDAQNRPMFDIGSSRLKNYTTDILREVTTYLRTVPNQISLTGHTDAAPYAGITGFTNWDLSTDRANAARRALEGAGLETERVARVVGLGSSVLFDKTDPRSAVNRRISIVVMTRDAVESAIKATEGNLLGMDSSATPITDSRVMPDVAISSQQAFSIPSAAPKETAKPAVPAAAAPMAAPVATPAPTPAPPKK